jgi:hypothetical protein
MAPQVLSGRMLVGGAACGDVLGCESGLSFWGGIDPETGIVIDRRHPWRDQQVTGRVLVMPGGRGSCTGSAVLLELAARGLGPAALLFREAETILPLGGLVAADLFGVAIPMVRLAAPDFAAALAATRAAIRNGEVALDGVRLPDVATPPPAPAALVLTDADRAMLAGDEGPARRWAMAIIIAMAGVMEAEQLIDITHAHLDCCIHTGPASVAIIERLAAMGARVKVPTTLNAISIDRGRWRELGFPAGPAQEAERQVAGYLAIGASATFTCAPYLLSGAPRRGEQIAWGESNAVAYANAVLGAMTGKYPDYLDLCAALTGRAPAAGCHATAGRAAQMLIEVEPPAAVDDAFYPLLGLVVGSLAPHAIPAVTGLERLAPAPDDLKAFAAAFATLSAAPMFHLIGLTPEAPDLERVSRARADLPVARIDRHRLASAWQDVAGAPGDRVRVACIAIGNPHASLPELRRLAALCRGLRCAAGVTALVTTSRATRDSAAAEGLCSVLAAFGFEVIVDTCWCMLTRPLVPADRGAIITSSGKYAHYGPGLVGGDVRLATLAACVQAAMAGVHAPEMPAWLGAEALAQNPGVIGDPPAT